MDNRLIHTPEGVRDIYGKELDRKNTIEGVLKNVIKSYGYQDVEIPSFEFFDVFSREIGTMPSRELYKFFDKENNTMVLRADFTPGIARVSAKYFREEKRPLRWTYMGNVFNNISDLQGKLKEHTEIGAECIGDSSVEADAELVAMVVKSLLKCGLKDFQISIGQIDFFKGICKSAGISDEISLELREQISGKNYFGTEQILGGLNLPERVKEQILGVSDCFGGVDALEKARTLADNETSKNAIERLLKLNDLLKVYGVDGYVSYDLGMLSKFHYYTGIIFRAYTYGVGEPIVKGGRYDSLLSQFGKDSAAIGFCVVVDQLINALNRQHVVIETASVRSIYAYEKDAYANAVVLATKERENGKYVELTPAIEGNSGKDYIPFGQEEQVEAVYLVTNQGATQI